MHAPRTRAAWLAFQLAFVAALALRPVIAGWPLAHGLGAAAFEVAFAWLPGCALLAWLGTERRALEHAFLAWVAGNALLALAFVPLCMLDRRGAIWALPALALAALVAARVRRGPLPLVAPENGELLALAIVCGLVLSRAILDQPDRWFAGFGIDATFHAANAAELRWRWPMEDPRIAGEALRYHFLAYVPPASLSVVSGIPVRECLLALLSAVGPLLLACGTFVAARAFGARTALAALAALALALHADLGEFTQRALDADLRFWAPLSLGIYDSCTTVTSLVCLVALAMLVARLLDRERHPGPERARGDAVLLALAALLAAGTKGSTLPPFGAALAFVALWRWIRPSMGGRAFPKREALATVIVLLAAAPMTLWLAADPSGYAGSMFRLAPGWIQERSPFQTHVLRFLGRTSGDPAIYPTLLALPAWLVGFLGAAGGGLCLWLFSPWLARGKPWLARGEPRARRAPHEAVLAIAALVGLLLAWLLAAPGFSQLFFGYVSCVCAALLGALGAERLLGVRTLAARAALGLCALLFAAHAWATLSFPPTPPTKPGPAPYSDAFWQSYRATLDWIRANAPPDAVLLVDEPRLAGAWTERRFFHELSRFSPRTHAQFDPAQPLGRTPPDPYAERAQAQAAFFAAPSAQTLARVRAQMPHDAPLYALRSRFELVTRDGTTSAEKLPAAPGTTADPENRWGGAAGAELVHEEPAAAVYRLGRRAP